MKLRECLQEMCTKPDVIHKEGNWYRHVEDGNFAMLARVGARTFALIGLNGNRWHDPIEISYLAHLTDKEWKSISGGEWKFVCGPQE